MHQTAVAYMKQENRGNALQAESLVMAFNELFSWQECKGNSLVVAGSKTAFDFHAVKGTYHILTTG